MFAFGGAPAIAAPALAPFRFGKGRKSRRRDWSEEEEEYYSGDEEY